MKNGIVKLLLGILVFFGAVNPGRAQSVVEGTWKGFMGMPSGDDFGFSLRIERRGEEAVGILAPDPVPNHRFEVTGLKMTPDVVAFQWRPMSSPIRCVLKVEGDAFFSGSCIESEGTSIPAVIAPPGIQITNARLPWKRHRTEMDKRRAQERLDALEGPRGTKIEMDGYGLYAHIEGDGRPAVVFLSDLGDDLRTWDYVHYEVQQFTSAVTYSRSGLGYSDPSPHERTPKTVAEELHALLENAEIPSPYVLVAHGLGTVFARAFAQEYGSSVAGLVLVDPVHELEGRRLSELDESSWASHMSRQENLYSLAPEPVAAEFALYRTIVDTGRIESVSALPDVPSVVLSSVKTTGKERWVGDTDAGQQAKRALHEQMIEGLSWKRHVAAEESGSYIHRENPSIVVDAIRDVLRAIEQGSSSVN